MLKGDIVDDRLLAFVASLRSRFGERAKDVALVQAEGATGAAAETWFSIIRELEKLSTSDSDRAGQTSDGDGSS